MNENDKTSGPDFVPNHMQLKFDFECLICAKLNSWSIGTDRPVYQELVHCKHCGKPMMIEYRTIVQANIFKIAEKPEDWFCEGRIVDTDDPTEER